MPSSDRDVRECMAVYGWHGALMVACVAVIAAVVDIDSEVCCCR
jgi:hypothetical protein